MTRTSTRAPKSKTRVFTLEGDQVTSKLDAVAGEEPLEIRLKTRSQTQTITVTMRTPGSDFELAAGYCFTEGIITSSADIKRITYCADAEQQYNTVNLELRADIEPDWSLLERNTVASSACGVCGKASLEAIEARGLEPMVGDARVRTQTLYALPEQLRAAQGLFDATGGLHAAALFSLEGKLLAVREDIGRHNALDKLLGFALLEGVPLEQVMVLVSGRAGFEIAQKCVAARVPILASVSAPSSLAVDVAKQFNLTLIGFLRGQRCNVYHGLERIIPIG